MSARTLVSFINASFRHPRGSSCSIPNLSFSIESNHAWVIAGPAYARSTVLEAIRGNLPVDSGTIEHPFLRREVWPTEVIKLLSSDENAAAGGAAYFSERYHARREDDDYTLKNWLIGGSKSASSSSSSSSMMVQEVTTRLDLVDKLESSMMNLSNGQNKRAKIAKTLLSRPRVLLLDEPYVGLDVSSRQKLEDMLGNFVKTEEPSVILSLRALDKLPSWTTHLLWLQDNGTTRYVGPIKDIEDEFKLELQKKDSSVRAQSSHVKDNDSKVLVDLDNVNLSYWGKPVLQDINWTIRAGDKWRLSGPNGSGKTSILALITGDHPKIYANKVTLFGARRDSKDTRSIFEIQAHMGHTSPEIHKHFPKFRSGRECIASGFSESMQPPRSLSHDQEHEIEKLVKYFAVEEHVSSPMAHLTPGLQRLFLLLRAFVKRPKLLVLDEPFGFMDDIMIVRAKQYIDEEVPGTQAVVMISHHDEEVPSSVNRQLLLSDGRVATSL